VQQEQRVVAAGAADVHVLAEHGELLGQVAVQRRQFLVARLGRDALLGPVLERMRAAARDADVQHAAGGDERVADLHQLGQQRAVVGLHARIYLDHALRDLGRHVARKRLALQQVHQVGAGRREVEIGQADELQFQFDAERQRCRVREGFKGHG